MIICGIADVNISKTKSLSFSGMISKELWHHIWFYQLAFHKNNKQIKHQLGNMHLCPVAISETWKFKLIHEFCFNSTAGGNLLWHQWFADSINAAQIAHEELFQSQSLLSLQISPYSNFFYFYYLLWIMSVITDSQILWRQNGWSFI